jgi:uncharacterized membrane protein
VLTFRDAASAGRTREALRRLERDGLLDLPPRSSSSIFLLDLEKASVVVREPSGTIRQYAELGQGIKAGAFGGAMAGLLLGFMFPLAGIAIGAASGALVEGDGGQGQ